MRREWVVGVLLFGACTPELGAPPSQISSNRILAIKAEPAEANLGDQVTFTALVASPDGTQAAPLVWALCSVPKPLDENNVVAADCTRSGDKVPPLMGPGPTTMGQIPNNACDLFGPGTPPDSTSDVPLRSRDADVTGGYYQPVRATFIAGASNQGDLVGFGLERLHCGLANAGADVASDYAKRYTLNQNPALDALSMVPPGGTPVPVPPAGGMGAPPEVAAKATVTLHATWRDGSAESYPVLDVVTHELTDHREALRLSWFATAGTFEHDRTGRGETETDVFTENNWTAPAASGVVQLWTVLRDSRGGVDFATFAISVTGP